MRSPWPRQRFGDSLVAMRITAVPDAYRPPPAHGARLSAHIDSSACRCSSARVFDFSNIDTQATRGAPCRYAPRHRAPDPRVRAIDYFVFSAGTVDGIGTDAASAASTAFLMSSYGSAPGYACPLMKNVGVLATCFVMPKA